MISQRMAKMALQSVRASAVTSLDALFLSLCQPCWKSFWAAGREHRANNVVYGWIVKLPTMWNCLAPVSSVQVVLRQIKANNCNSLYKSVILNVNIFQREKLHADVSLSLFFLHFASSECVRIWLHHAADVYDSDVQARKRTFWRKCKGRDQIGVGWL